MGLVWAWEAYGKGSQFLQKKIKHNKKLFYSLYLAVEQPLVITHVEIPTVTENPKNNLLVGTGRRPRERFSGAFMSLKAHLAGFGPPKNQSSPNFGVTTIWVFPKIGVPQNGWFIMENPIKMDDLGVPSF